MSMKISFSGNLKIDAEINGKVIKTDQPAKEGGDESAPAPFEYFLASLGTCAGVYVAKFCQTRNISYENIEIEQKIDYDRKNKRIGKVIIDIKLPEDFPEKYKRAVVKASNMCAVKKYLENPFEIETKTTAVERV